jgi:hypothetical protein
LAASGSPISVLSVFPCLYSYLSLSAYFQLLVVASTK